MKLKIFFLTLLVLTVYNSSFSQYLSDLQTSPLTLMNKKQSPLKGNALPGPSVSMGFNMGAAVIEGTVGFAIGAFAELGAKGITFVPQANYWTAKGQNNFELAGLARFSLGEKPLIPYIDGGLGVNFYNSDAVDFTKLSLIAGGGVEMTNVSSTFNLLFDGKYKLIVSDSGNLSCFIFTVGMKFPFK